MSLPHEYWIKYMLLHPDVKKKSIPQVAELYGLIVPSAAQIKKIADKLNSTKPKPFNLKSTKVRNWLRRQRVYSMMFEHKDAVEARSFLGNHKLRRCLQFLIMADTPRKRIPEYCAERSGVKPSVGAVKLFEHYFWKRDNLPFHEWVKLLEKHPDKEHLLDCHERGAEFALWKLGYREEIPTDFIVKGVLHEATMRFFETGGRRNSRDTAMTAKLWSETIFRSLEELNKSGDAVQEILDELKQIAIKLEKADIKSIEELTEGRHSRTKGKS